MINAENVKISVVMPIYNADDYLKPAIDGVLSQTLTDIELICVDDGSTDNSLSIIKSYQQAVYPRCIRRRSRDRIPT